MPSIELSKLQAVTSPRALSDTDNLASKPSSASAAPSAPKAPKAAGGVAIDVGAAVDTAKAPVDTDRVAEIKQALQEGSYPLVPAEIADAMIAAQVSFGISK